MYILLELAFSNKSSEQQSFETRAGNHQAEDGESVVYVYQIARISTSGTLTVRQVQDKSISIATGKKT